MPRMRVVPHGLLPAPLALGANRTGGSCRSPQSPALRRHPRVCALPRPEDPHEITPVLSRDRALDRLEVPLIIERANDDALRGLQPAHLEALRVPPRAVVAGVE